jgi:hypothetical protein
VTTLLANEEVPCELLPVFTVPVERSCVTTLVVVEEDELAWKLSVLAVLTDKVERASGDGTQGTVSLTFVFFFLWYP